MKTMRAFLRPIVVAMLACSLALPAPACTIFVLTDPEHTLFFNNEDFENPKTRLWFIPAGKDFFGCAYVGFDDGWAQGGVNTEGVAFDWVAGFSDSYAPDDSLNFPRGNPAQRMLETCASVDQAIAFFRTNREPSFARSRIMIADRSGASVIIGARDGKLLVEKSDACRGFGYGGDVVDAALTKKPKPSVANGMKILRAAKQSGLNATKYSTVYDLKHGDIHVFPANDKKGIHLNLNAELAKGAHYFEIPDLRHQIARPPQPLLPNMVRLPLDAFAIVADDAPEVAARVKTLAQEIAAGNLNEKDFTAKLFNELAPQKQSLHTELEKLGPLRRIDRVEARPHDSPRAYRYRMDFANATVLQTYVLDENNRIASINSEDIEQRPRSR